MDRFSPDNRFPPDNHFPPDDSGVQPRSGDPSPRPLGASRRSRLPSLIDIDRRHRSPVSPGSRGPLRRRQRNLFNKFIYGLRGASFHPPPLTHHLLSSSHSRPFLWIIDPQQSTDNSSSSWERRRPRSPSARPAGIWFFGKRCGRGGGNGNPAVLEPPPGRQRRVPGVPPGAARGHAVPLSPRMPSMLCLAFLSPSSSFLSQSSSSSFFPNLMRSTRLIELTKPRTVKGRKASISCLGKSGNAAGAGGLACPFPVGMHLPGWPGELPEFPKRDPLAAVPAARAAPGCARHRWQRPRGHHLLRDREKSPKFPNFPPAPNGKHSRDGAPGLFSPSREGSGAPKPAGTSQRSPAEPPQTPSTSLRAKIWDPAWLPVDNRDLRL